MHSRMRRRFLAAGLIASVCVPSLSYAAGPMHQRMGEKMHGKRMEAMKQFHEELGLTSEQQEKLKTLKQDFREETRSLHELIREKQTAMYDYIGQATAEKAKAEMMQEEIGDLMEDLYSKKLDHWFAMRDILTPEQAQKLAAHKQERMTHRMEKYDQMRKHAEEDMTEF